VSYNIYIHLSDVFWTPATHYFVAWFTCRWCRWNWRPTEDWPEKSTVPFVEFVPVLLSSHTCICAAGCCRLTKEWSVNSWRFWLAATSSKKWSRTNGSETYLIKQQVNVLFVVNITVFSLFILSSQLWHTSADRKLVLDQVNGIFRSELFYTFKKQSRKCSSGHIGTAWQGETM